MSHTEPSRWSDAWYQEEHAETFSSVNRRYLTQTLIRQCLEFNEGKLLASLASTFQCRSISDIGCGTGLFYPVVRALWPAAEYRGFDISPAAVRKAQRLHPRGQFMLLTTSLASAPDAPADLVFSRDVAHHQTDPRGFLRELYEITQRYLLLRIRTRERGATVYDPERSCQYTYGHWVPFIVLNTAELLDILRTCAPMPRAITVRKHPVVLGGQGGRFLPKELYDPNAGTAETVVLIEKPQEAELTGDPLVDIATHPERHQEPLLYRVGRRIARRIKLKL